MQYDANTHSLQCPKCRQGMEAVTYGDTTVDRCTNCKGIWFDPGEVEALRKRWMGEALDSGDSGAGKRWNEVDDVNCPRCGKPMQKAADSRQPHIWYEFCDEHGMFLDAGEFTDMKYETLVDKIRDIVTGKRKS